MNKFLWTVTDGLRYFFNSIPLSYCNNVDIL